MFAKADAFWTNSPRATGSTARRRQTQECENLLATHPKVRDAAVFGVPNEEMGEAVKAVVQLMPNVEPGPETEAELIAFCRKHLAHMKCPLSINFEDDFPRLPTGKLYKTALRDRYWKGHKSRIL